MNLERLADEFAGVVADQVAELLADQLPAAVPAGEPWHLLNLEEAAGRLTRSTRWVRDHKDEIGWVKLDGGALAFDVDDLRRFARERRIGGARLQAVSGDAAEQGFSASSLRAEQKASLASDR